MRISGGRARNIQLRLPKRGSLRPATDYLRQAVFSSLAPILADTRVLDLFAGTGAYGLEALSRGASHVTWVDANRASTEVITENLAAVAKALGSANPDTLGRATTADIFLWQPSPGEKFDLIFISPPYPLLPSFGGQLVARAVGWVSDNPEARLILEAPGDYTPELPAGWKAIRRLGKGRRQPSSTFIVRDAI